MLYHDYNGQSEYNTKNTRASKWKPALTFHDFCLTKCNREVEVFQVFRRMAGAYILKFINVTV